MANYSQQEGTSLSLALESTRQRFAAQMDAIKHSLIEKHYGTDVELTLQKIMTDAIKRNCEMTYLTCSRRPGPDGPRVVSAELFARSLIQRVWMSYRKEIEESLDPIFKPDPLPEDLWYQEPLSPEQAEYLKTKAQNPQSAMSNGGAPVEVPPRAELTRCCFQRIDYDQGASMHVWNQFLSKWATTNHKEEPWYIRVPADKDYLFFGEDGIDMEPLLSMCPRGAHLHSEYVGGNGDGPRMLRIGIYLKAPTYGPIIIKPAEGRVTSGHEASMVSMFLALVDWSIRVTMGVECPFSTLLKSHHLKLAHNFSKAMGKVVATSTKLAKDQLESQARAEEAERSRQEAERKAEIQAAKERHAKKLQDETAHIEKSTRGILRSYENDEVKCRQGLKILIAETDEFIQDDAQRWTIIVTYISRDWPDKADWASELMSKQGYGEARPT